MSKLTLAILSIGVALVIAIEGAENDVLKQKKPSYQGVIELVRKGELKTLKERGITIPQGMVRLPSSAMLPPELQSASVDGEIYVSRPSPGQLIIIFRTRQGKAFNMEGFLFAARALTDRDLRKDYYGNNCLLIDSVEFVVEKCVEKNWYAVSRGLD